ncbi:MAG: SDR family oxidoreductase [Pirellulaceae bacterium]
MRIAQIKIDLELDSSSSLNPEEVASVINGSQKSMQPNNRYTLLTGATGLVGHYLMRDLLLAGERLAVAVRDSKQAKGFERIDDILKFWEDELLDAIASASGSDGCITAKHCGLSSQELAWLRANCGRVLHNAAVLTFEGPDRSREPWVTNVGGTQNILNLCREVGITDLHYVSTAYVCGEQSGVVMESQLDVGQDFRNDYERSKFEAEKLVRDCAWIEPPTIYRPAVISGDSRTGYTSSYHGLYLYLRLMATLVPRQPVDEDGYRHTPIRLPMSGSEPRNVVPVEWVSAVMCRLLNREDARGKTFHLAPELGITARRVVEYLLHLLPFQGSRVLW